MRLLLLLLLAVLSALATPLVVSEVRDDLLPGMGSVSQSWSDALEIARLLRENRNREVGSPEIEPSEPLFEEQRLLRTVSVSGVALLWFLTFTIGGIAGLALLAARTSTLLIFAGVLMLLAYSCSQTRVTVSDMSPDAERWIKAAFGLALAGTVSGFLTARSFRRTTV